MTTSTDRSRRALAFAKAIVENDTAAAAALGPETPRLLERLWEADPLRAAMLTPTATADHQLVTSLTALVITVAEQPAMNTDELTAWLGALLELDRSGSAEW